MEGIKQLIIQIIRNYFIRYRIQYSEHQTYDLWLVHYFNLRLKLIGQMKRQVKISFELMEKLKTHSENEVFNSIVQSIVNGDDLNSFQSKKSFNSDEDDGLFNDWGIHHLHLNTVKDNLMDYFVSRSKDLIFAIFADDTAYLIDIYGHKNAWSRRHLISIIQNNWDEIIKNKEVPNARYNPELTDNDIYAIRKKGYNFGVSVNGKSYLLLGHGQSRSSDNALATDRTIVLIRWIRSNINIYNEDKNIFQQLLIEQLEL